MPTTTDDVCDKLAADSSHRFSTASFYPGAPRNSKEQVLDHISSGTPKKREQEVWNIVGDYCCGKRQWEEAAKCYKLAGNKKKHQEMESIMAEAEKKHKERMRVAAAKQKRLQQVWIIVGDYCREKRLWEEAVTCYELGQDGAKKRLAKDMDKMKIKILRQLEAVRKKVLQAAKQLERPWCWITCCC
ncbi:uncharacterized protein LOC119727906 [Patiria miniata]|uniref:Uncharacterized protein n=1 Tax=Patiria miniata TaxID=46514 RepID=A0A913ZW80_PATMI|nr:uncharacterized protein LOC119727906 [Patiria miniata]